MDPSKPPWVLSPPFMGITKFVYDLHLKYLPDEPTRRTRWLSRKRFKTFARA